MSATGAHDPDESLWKATPAPREGTGQRQLMGLLLQHFTPRQGYKETHSARRRINSDVIQEGRKGHNDISGRWVTAGKKGQCLIACETQVTHLP